MIRSGFGLLLLMVLTGFGDGKRDDVYMPVKNESFSRGETLEFKMTYGIFTVGRGLANIDPEYYRINDRDCYKVDVFGKTVGFVSWVKDVDDQWGAYIDTAALVPHRFYRKIHEGSYKKEEITYFNHPEKKIRVKATDRKTGEFKEPKVYDAPAQVRDMIGGFLYLRTMDLSRLKVNDTIMVTGFFEDEFYKLPIVYKGKKVIKTKGRLATPGRRLVTQLKSATRKVSPLHTITWELLIERRARSTKRWSITSTHCTFTNHLITRKVLPHQKTTSPISIP